MFLGVSGSLVRMVEMNEKRRQALGLRIRARRRDRFGTKSAAYRQAGINSATWDRIENGESVREDRLLAALQVLWPDQDPDQMLQLNEVGQIGPAWPADELRHLVNGLLSAVGKLETIPEADPEDIQALRKLAVDMTRALDEQEGGSHEDLVDPAEKSGDGVVTPTTQAELGRAARHANVPDKLDD